MKSADEIRRLDAGVKARLEEELRQHGIEWDDIREAVKSLLVHCELCDRDLAKAKLPERRGPISGARRRVRAMFDLTQDDIIEEANEAG